MLVRKEGIQRVWFNAVQRWVCRTLEEERDSGEDEGTTFPAFCCSNIFFLFTSNFPSHEREAGKQRPILSWGIKLAL